MASAEHLTRSNQRRQMLLRGASRFFIEAGQWRFQFGCQPQAGRQRHRLKVGCTGPGPKHAWAVRRVLPRLCKRDASRGTAVHRNRRADQVLRRRFGSIKRALRLMNGPVHRAPRLAQMMSTASGMSAVCQRCEPAAILGDAAISALICAIAFQLKRRTEWRRRQRAQVGQRRGLHLHGLFHDGQ